MHSRCSLEIHLIHHFVVPLPPLGKAFIRRSWRRTAVCVLGAVWKVREEQARNPQSSQAHFGEPLAPLPYRRNWGFIRRGGFYIRPFCGSIWNAPLRSLPHPHRIVGAFCERPQANLCPMGTQFAPTVTIPPSSQFHTMRERIDDIPSLLRRLGSKKSNPQVALFWSCYPDSDRRPHAYQACALPAEL